MEVSIFGELTCLLYSIIKLFLVHMYLTMNNTVHDYE